MRKTKIVCTLGPASQSEEKIEQLILAGMNVARFNFSHGTHESHQQLFDRLDRVRTRLGVPVAAMLDTKGPEIRLGTFENGGVQLQAGQPFVLTAQQLPGNAQRASVSYPQLWQDVQPGDSILLDDGLIALKVNAVEGQEIRCTVCNGGPISDRKGINLPGVELSLPYLSEQDRDDILFGARTGFDFIAASFVSSAADVVEVRRLLEQEHCSSIKIIAKIESAKGVENIEEILRVADGVMVARGDMGVEIPLEEVPIVQKSMIKKALACGKVVITATQMLESMTHHPRPTRAEAADVANAIYDGTSAVMLSGETASGQFPVEAVKTMANIAARAEQDINYAKRLASMRIQSQPDVTYAISHATCSTAHDLNAAAIITVTHSGHTARMTSRFRPSVPIIGCTPTQSTYRQLSLSWGVTPLLIPERHDSEELLNTAVGYAQQAGLIQPGDLVVLTAGVPIGIPGTTNLLQVQVAGDVLATGHGVGQGEVIAPLAVFHSEAEALQAAPQGAILVIPRTSNELMPLLKKCAGIITEEGGADSHAAVVGLTLDIPVVVGVANASKFLKSGVSVYLNAAKGMICNSSQYKKQ